MLQNHQNINQNALAKKLNITKSDFISEIAAP